MVSRTLLLAAICLYGPALSDADARQLERSEGAVPPAQATPATESPPVSEETVEQALDAATDGLDRLESGQNDEATQPILEGVVEQIEFVQRNRPDHPMLPFLYGRAYAITGRQGEAVEQLQKFVETREGRNDWRAFKLLGDLLCEQYPQLAKAHYKNAAALKADEPGVLFGLARCAAGRGRTAEAIRLGREAVRADRRSQRPEIRYPSFLARALLADRQWDEAEREAGVALRLAEEAKREHPGQRKHVEVLDAQYKLLIEIQRAHLTEEDGTVDDYVRFAECVRDRAEVTATLSLYDVLTIFEAAVDKVTPDVPPRLMEQHAIVLAQIGRRQEAAAMFERLLEADPDNAVAPVWLKRLKEESAGLEAPDKP
jgi:tetratricopeptide (TPR) repeat protein